MDYHALLVENKGGFNFDNVERNKQLKEAGTKLPGFLKTGTTICGLVCKDAVILGADTRATEGPIVADKVCDKLHNMAANICCAGAGTSGDLTHTTNLIASQLELHRQRTKREPRVVTCVTRLSQLLFRYQGHIGCALVLGGVDITGPQLYTVHPHGSSDSSPYSSMGSGSLAAMAVLEKGYRDNMSIEDGMNLVADAIRAGIYNDLGSGSHVDLAVVTNGKTTYYHGFDTKANTRLYRLPKPVSFPIGTTVVIDKNEAPIEHC